MSISGFKDLAAENASILIVLQMRGILTKELLDKLLERLDILCRQITTFQKSIKQKNSMLYALCFIPNSACDMPYAP
jgi:hypothetical protein